MSTIIANNGNHISLMWFTVLYFIYNPVKYNISYSDEFVMMVVVLLKAPLDSLLLWYHVVFRNSAISGRGISIRAPIKDKQSKVVLTFGRTLISTSLESM